MATIRTRITKKNDEKYHVMIRKKGIDICKSFSKKEDAELFSKYKESLIDNMDAFEKDIKDTITLSSIFMMKLQSIDPNSKRTFNDIKNAHKTFSDFFCDKQFASEITFEDWKDFAIQLYGKDVYRGSKHGGNVRKISLETLRKLFAYASAAFSFAQSQGIEIENHPLRVIQTFIRPLSNK